MCDIWCMLCCITVTTLKYQLFGPVSSSGGGRGGGGKGVNGSGGDRKRLKMTERL